MGLKKIGDNSGDNGDGTNQSRKKVDDFTRDAERRFGIGPEDSLTGDEPTSIEESFEQIKQNTPEGTADALLIMMSAITMYNDMQNDPGNAQLLSEFYKRIDTLSHMSPEVLRTVIASGIVATATLREQMKEED